MPAAGSGKRMAESEKPKQYLKILDKTVIEWALLPFINDERCVGIVVALAKDDAHWPTLALSTHSKIRIANGGAERVGLGSVMDCRHCKVVQRCVNGRVNGCWCTMRCAHAYNVLMWMH